MTDTVTTDLFLFLLFGSKEIFIYLVKDVLIGHVEATQVALKHLTSDGILSALEALHVVGRRLARGIVVHKNVHLEGIDGREGLLTNRALVAQRLVPTVLKFYF
jgi:hypothetical protein